MTDLTALGDILVCALGYAACWYSKDTIKKWALGSEVFAAALERKAKAIKAAL
jgi:hypothetical protein